MEFRSRSLSPLARSLAALAALAAAGALILEIVDSVLADPDQALVAILWRHARYFTILTNALVFVTFAGMTLSRRMAWGGWLGGMTTWIAITGLVYHVLLARPLTGLAFWADLGLHSVVPVLTLLWWLAFAPKARLSPGSALTWLAWPLIYILYVLARGHADGKYPYFFLDPMDVGWDGVTIWSGIIGLAFFVAGLVLVAIARMLRR
ncbi:Pr6Pr family membrane protein [Pseudooceanicola algae]|nr:Pr6Pr family membrane protein [Pseudooceanicola algae]